MLVLKKKEIVAACLVAMIGVAGYLNWSYQDTVHVTDNDEYVKTGKTLGKAEYVSSTKEVETIDNDYFAKAKTNKENAKAQALEILENSAQNESFDEKTRKDAQNKILEMADNTEKENAIENLARSKGYDEISVYIDEAFVNVTVRKENFNEKDANIICSMITEQLNCSADKVKIVSK